MSAARWVEVAFGAVAFVTFIAGDVAGITWSQWTAVALGGAVGLVIPRPTDLLAKPPQ